MMIIILRCKGDPKNIGDAGAGGSHARYSTAPQILLRRPPFAAIGIAMHSTSIKQVWWWAS
jgi:hypothetical protein